MPIEPEYKWGETERFIGIKVKVPGLKQEEFNDRVKMTPIFFNITLAPYLLQIDFLHEINVYTAQCRAQKPYFKFIFEKKKPKLWGSLHEDRKSEDLLTKRKESLQVLEKKVEDFHRKSKLAKDERAKVAQKAQWGIDEKIRDTIEALEQKEKEDALAQISNFLTEDETKLNKEEAGKLMNEIPKATIGEEESKGILAEFGKDIAEEIEKVKDIDQNDTNTVENEPARKCVQIGVKFTPWDYVTPKRENKVPPNFAKQSIVHPNDNDRNFEETQPLFLRDKGNTFFEKGDFESANAAFSESLAILPQPSVYISRAICHFKHERWNLALSDVKIAVQQLDQLESAPDGILAMISCFEGMLHFKMKEFESSLECWKCNLSIEGEIASEWAILGRMKEEFALFKTEHQAKARNFIEGTKKLLILKEKGDSFFKAGDFKFATALYSEALENGSTESKEGLRVVLNRSAAYLAAEHWWECLEDCNTLLNTLSLLSLDQRIKTYIRRGTSYFRLSQKYLDPSQMLEKAHLDFCMANGLGGSRSIAADAKKVEKIWNEIPKPEYHFREGQYKSAAEDFLILSHISELKHQYLANASTCYLRMMQLKKCETLAKQCLEMESSNALIDTQCKVNLAFCYCYRGDLSASKQALEKMIDESEDEILRQNLKLQLKKIVEKADVKLETSI